MNTSTKLANAYKALAACDYREAILEKRVTILTAAIKEIKNSLGATSYIKNVSTKALKQSRQISVNKSNTPQP